MSYSIVSVLNTLHDLELNEATQLVLIVAGMVVEGTAEKEDLEKVLGVLECISIAESLLCSIHDNLTLPTEQNPLLRLDVITA